MRASKNEDLNGETHLIKVKKEVVDYEAQAAQQKEGEEENDMPSVENGTQRARRPRSDQVRDDFQGQGQGQSPRIKVHIVRRNALADGDGALDPANAKESNREKVDAKSLKESTTRENAESFIRRKIVHDNSLTGSHTTFMGDSNQSKNCTNRIHTESMECFHNAATFVDFHSFTITVKGFDIGSELSENICTKYYDLCLSRKLYLHERLLETVKPKLAAELISETVEIVDAIRGSGIFTSQDEFVVWDKTLESFELLGMEVGFLRSRLNQLKQKKHLFESEIDNHIKKLKARYDLMFQEAARAAW